MAGTVVFAWMLGGAAVHVLPPSVVEWRKPRTALVDGLGRRGVDPTGPKFRPRKIPRQAISNG
ncbi:MAG: hypothetical protein ACRELB_17100 [Polyangiaceae bacterium]